LGGFGVVADCALSQPPPTQVIVRYAQSREER